MRRFYQPWERTASIQLRVGDTRAIDAYHTNGRIRGGAATDMIDAAYAAWAADEHTGLASLLIADTNAAVAEFNTRARADRIAWRLVEPDGHRLHDGTLAGIGDRIVTRQIDRTLRTGPQSWVKNGDQWIVVRRSTDGSLAVRRLGQPHTGKVLTLPAAYVAANVELAYATIAREARRQRWTALAQACFPHADPAQITQSDAWPGLITAWRRAEAAGLDLDTALPRLSSSLPDTGDPVTVLSEWVHRWCDLADPAAPQPRTLIAGLIPAAGHAADPDTRQALAERAALIEQRAEALVARAVAAGEPWLSQLGPPPNDPASRLQWEHAAATVAAYRDRHGVTDPANAFGEARGGGHWTRRADRQHAQAAAVHARRLAITHPGHPAQDSLHNQPRLEIDR